jgi:hypothetical protein
LSELLDAVYWVAREIGFTVRRYLLEYLFSEEPPNGRHPVIFDASVKMPKEIQDTRKIRIKPLLRRAYRRSLTAYRNREDVNGLRMLQRWMRLKLTNSTSISRYVDTFEEEELVVSRKCRRMIARLKSARNFRRGGSADEGYLRELGL